MKDMNFVGLTGGENGTWYQVLAQRPGVHKDYKSYKNGVELSLDHPDYWQNKKERYHSAIYLTVTGNPVTCASDLTAKGYRAIAVKATQVVVTLDSIF